MKRGFGVRSEGPTLREKLVGATPEKDGKSRRHIFRNFAQTRFIFRYVRLRRSDRVGEVFLREIPKLTVFAKALERFSLSLG